MTAYFRENSLKAGDDVILIHNDDDTYSIQYKRQATPNLKIVETQDGKQKKRLVLGTGWKVIEC